VNWNLLDHPFAPFRLASGEQRWLAIAELTKGMPDGDYPIEPDWPRPDFNIATFELLIGLLTVALPPRREKEWRDRWDNPPSREELEAALAPLHSAFGLDGDGPRFLQEFGGLDGEPRPIEALLIDTPGANGQNKNSDLLTHRNRYPALSLPAAGMALYSLQAYSPAGGRGILTSIRGGGPLTALVIPQSPETARPMPLWHRVWANVGMQRDDPPAPERLFPWLQPTRDKGKGPLHDSDPSTHPLHAFFGMPRRIRLTFAEEGICAMTGARGKVATGFIQAQGGIEYGGWQHPLTPYRRLKEADEPFSAKPKAGRFGYRDWVAATIGDTRPTPLRLPAHNVQVARNDRTGLLRADDAAPDPRIRVGGWAMNNMEAISYLVAETPLHFTAVDRQAQLDQLALRLAEAGEIAASTLHTALMRALGLAGDGGVLRQARTAFLSRTDDVFHRLLDDGVAGADAMHLARHWAQVLRRTAQPVFDDAAPVPLDDAQRARDVVTARGGMILSLQGYGKIGTKLFAALQLPAPETRRKEEA
jgi:CRISPR system Cascade subunit CasA